MSDDFASRLEGIETPRYVTITIADDATVSVASNLETAEDIRRALAMVQYHFAGDLEWSDLYPED